MDAKRSETKSVVICDCGGDANPDHLGMCDECYAALGRVGKLFDEDRERREQEHVVRELTRCERNLKRIHMIHKEIHAMLEEEKDFLLSSQLSKLQSEHGSSP